MKRNEYVKDRGMLVLTGLVAFYAAWLFFRGFQENAFDIIGTLYMLSLIIENHNLKKSYDLLTPSAKADIRCEIQPH